MSEAKQNTRLGSSTVIQSRMKWPGIQGTWGLAQAVWPQTSHPTCHGLVLHVCQIGITHPNQLFVFLAIYIPPASKKDPSQLVIRCYENRLGKSKTTGKEEGETETPATRPNIASVANLTLFALDPRKHGAKFVIPELHNLSNYLFEEKNLLFRVVPKRQASSQNKLRK